VEWDTYCSCTVNEYFGALIEHDIVAPSFHLPRQDQHCWWWFSKRKTLPSPLREHAAGIAPFSLILVSDRALNAMCQTLPPGDLGAGNGELRFASLACACGFQPVPNQIAVGHNGFRPLPVNTQLGPGMWHPVKWLARQNKVEVPNLGSPVDQVEYPLVVFTLWKGGWTEQELVFFDYLLQEVFLPETHFVWITPESCAANVELESRWELLSARSVGYTIELIEFPQSRLDASVNYNQLLTEIAAECLANASAAWTLCLNPGDERSLGRWPFRCEKTELDGLRRAIESAMPQRTRVFRILPEGPHRSAVAIVSHAGLDIVDIPAVPPEADTLQARERATSLAHANVMRSFLESDADFAVVLEDDAILCDDRSWMAYTDFDLFIPFGHNRQHRPPNATIQHGKLPTYGAFAFRCSRRFALGFLPRLLAGEIADHALHRAAAGFRVASFFGNLVNHDNQCASLISEERRKRFIGKGQHSIGKTDSEADAARDGCLRHSES
jgi:hypothetical protein